MGQTCHRFFFSIPDGLHVRLEGVKFEYYLLYWFQINTLELFSNSRIYPGRSSESSRKRNRHGRSTKKTIWGEIFRACVKDKRDQQKADENLNL